MKKTKIGDEIELFGHKGIILDIWGEEWRTPDYIIYCQQCQKFHATMTGYISGVVWIEDYDFTYARFDEMNKRLHSLKGITVTSQCKSQCKHETIYHNGRCVKCGLLTS